MTRSYRRLALAALLLALVVVSLGAYVRLSDAGLGCPDWPGCYGQLVAFPMRPMRSMPPSIASGSPWRHPRPGRR
jgi:heme A synthase